MNAPDTGVGGTQTGRMSDAPTVGREAFVKEFRERMQGKLPDDKIDAAAEAMTAATTSYVAIMVPITVLVYTRVQVLIHDSKAPTSPQFGGNAGGLIIPPLPLISAATSAPFLPTISRGFALRSAGRSSSMLRRSTRASLSGTTTTCSSATSKVAPRIAIRRWGRRDRLLVTLPNLSQPGSGRFRTPEGATSRCCFRLLARATRRPSTPLLLPRSDSAAAPHRAERALGLFVQGGSAARCRARRRLGMVGAGG
jgi:hypothetical protein